MPECLLISDFIILINSIKVDSNKTGNILRNTYVTIWNTLTINVFVNIRNDNITFIDCVTISLAINKTGRFCPLSVYSISCLQSCKVKRFCITSDLIS